MCAVFWKRALPGLLFARFLVPIAAAAESGLSSAAGGSRDAPPFSPQVVLDIQKLRVVPVPRQPSEVLTCDVLVVGGGLGGVAAAEAAARQRRTVILVEPTAMLGGQLTAQGISVPDENRFIESEPGTGTRAYRALREQVRAHYRATPGIVPGRERNVGRCWVSRVSGEPAVWEAAIRERLEAVRPGTPAAGAGGVTRILMRAQLAAVRRFSGSGPAHYADFVNLETGRLTRVAARYLLDATEMGDGLDLAGAPWTVGAEGRDEHQEPHAPPAPRPDWIQSFTYCFAVRWDPEGPRQIVPKPPGYEFFRSLGEYTLAYDYSDARGRVYYKVFARAPGSGGPFWDYRRLIDATSFEDGGRPPALHATPPPSTPSQTKGNPRYAHDLSLINWRGNDFHLENPIGQTIGQQIRVLWRAKEFALGFLYWLQTECPRDEGGFGYPEMQLATDVMGSEDGLALHPYIRESRRLLAQFTLTENHLLPPQTGPTAFRASPTGYLPLPLPPPRNGEGIVSEPIPLARERSQSNPPLRFGEGAGGGVSSPTRCAGQLPADAQPAYGEEFFDTVGIALYAMDIHPARSEPPLLLVPLPYHLPLGAFIPRSGPANVLPAAKNFGATRLALSSARVHPTEWLAGEVAGNLAAFCLNRNVLPADVRNTPDLLAAFQAQLHDSGVTLRWREVLGAGGSAG